MRASSQFADATAGVVYIHSSPAALCPHIEWALASALGAPATLRWTAQPAAAGQLRATSDWVGPVGTAARIAQALRSWPVLRFEVTEDPSEGVDGERYSFVPTLGLWHGSTSANGDVTIGEMRLRVMLQTARELDKYSGYDLAAELDRALGTAWDEDLEVYRGGSEGAEVTWLRRDVG
ncbi:DUF3145 domain-containing protein [Nocardia cyriacigeorgica]|uniref:DUF3145 domain-containing protein n=1 Tax=Nocardia cyriacigeorgica TaxID=135487 RepID=A0A6P1CJ39_9NOCA|nr:DUF3145 domain-containing protein [Nocardia cyriacigeorgica]MBF6083243.1 DUF3145 domain-containing protein [Nocardia cyriacigeorgica]MBF6288059.1 DUF3145 domain-containing protein [Nocardia cyriacigeorgica]MBF6426990.1 DUF3145 domain-containing protein [Nocardia cyriacigeorgica]MBF6498738.1 DUF3145 domain-containing protein [Nocardia cyriacigeorgica]NEW32438.1 DUF3145 domain-containing protein [Nocardia cyriacigeorgica]